MPFDKTNPFQATILSVLFLIGLSLLAAGIYGFYWLANEAYLIFTQEQAPTYLEQFLIYINEQNYSFSGNLADGENFNLSISTGIAQWLYAFLAIILLRVFPEILKILVSTGSEIILNTLKWFNTSEKNKSTSGDTNNEASQDKLIR